MNKEQAIRALGPEWADQATQEGVAWGQQEAELYVELCGFGSLPAWRGSTWAGGRPDCDECFWDAYETLREIAARETWNGCSELSEIADAIEQSIQQDEIVHLDTDIGDTSDVIVAIDRVIEDDCETDYTMVTKDIMDVWGTQSGKQVWRLNIRFGGE
jgi:hypothetical protein